MFKSLRARPSLDHPALAARSISGKNTPVPYPTSSISSINRRSSSAPTPDSAQLEHTLEFDAAYDPYGKLVTTISQTQKLPLTKEEYGEFIATPFQFFQQIDLTPGQYASVWASSTACRTKWAHWRFHLLSARSQLRPLSLPAKKRASRLILKPRLSAIGRASAALAPRPAPLAATLLVSKVTAPASPVPVACRGRRSGPSKPVAFAISARSMFCMYASSMPFLQVPVMFSSVSPSSGFAGIASSFASTSIGTLVTRTFVKRKFLNSGIRSRQSHRQRRHPCRYSCS